MVSNKDFKLGFEKGLGKKGQIFHTRVWAKVIISSIHFSDRVRVLNKGYGFKLDFHHRVRVSNEGF